MEQSGDSLREKRETAIAALEHTLSLFEAAENLSDERRDEIIAELMKSLYRYWTAYWYSP